jgi:hypothetical protein
VEKEGRGMLTTLGIAKKLREDHSLEIEMLKERVTELQSQLSLSHNEQSRQVNMRKHVFNNLFTYVHCLEYK